MANRPFPSTTTMSSSVPKAVLYYSPSSIWSAVVNDTIKVLLALYEKGYGDDEVNFKIVDINKGENFAPSFLRLNPKGTVPTLVVPFQDSLAADTESRYKALTDTKSIVEFLDKSRSAVSRTNTTSSAPAPALAPATIAFTTMSSKIIDDVLHSGRSSPNTLLLMNARDDASLQELAKVLVPFLTARSQALAGYISEGESGAIMVSERTKNFWLENKVANDTLLSVMSQGDKPSSALDASAKAIRDDYFSNAKEAWEVSLKENLVQLNGELIGPYSLGDQISVADVHLAAWLARIVMLSGGHITDEGDEAITKVETHIGSEFKFARDFTPPLPGGAPRQDARPDYQSKLAAFWDAIRERASFKKVYANGLY